MLHDAPLPFITTRAPGQALELGRQVLLSLARLATLQGYPITYREFESLAQNLDSQALSGVPLAGRIGVLWQSRFPQAKIRAPAWPPKPGDLPALWIGPGRDDGNGSVLTVLGALTNGALSSIDDTGQSVVLQPEQACHGRLLVLEPGVLAADANHPIQVSRESARTEHAKQASPPAGDARLSKWVRRWLRMN